MEGDPNYAQKIFDDMAPVFEKRLVEGLGYHCPWDMRTMFDSLVQRQKDERSNPQGFTLPATEIGHWRILDLGCGSGLVGRLFADIAIAASVDNKDDLSAVVATTDSLMLGIDVSAAMVKLAMEKGGYTMTACADLKQVLRMCAACNPSSHLDMIVAADTFLYVGILGEVFHLANKSLKANGLFMFSTEDLELSPMKISHTTSTANTEIPEETSDTISSAVEYEPPSNSNFVQLLSSARYAHSPTYIQELATRYAFEIISEMKITIRTENTVPLPGYIYILHKKDIIL
jgi:predicted TPR repeat methyltransferase